MAEDVRILFDDDIGRLADMGALVEVMKDALRAQRDGGLVSPPRHAVKFAPGNLVFTIGGTSDYAGFRVYNTFGRIAHTSVFVPGANPAAQAEGRQIVAVWDLKTNRLQGLVIGAWLSAWRAGSIGAAALDLTAPRAPRIAAVIGTGVHATTQLLGLAATRQPETIRVFGRNPENRRRFADAMARRTGRNVVAADSAEAAVRDADIVLCATNAGAPVIDAAWIAPNAYVGSAGPKFAKATELPAALGARASLILTDTPAQLAEFRTNHFLSGTPDFDRARPVNEYLDGAKPPPREGITLFMLTGLSGTEVLTAAWLLAAAEREAGAPGASRRSA